MFALPHRVTFYCPSQDANGQVLQSATVIAQETIRELAGRFGGATCQDAQGAWVNENGQVIQEAVKLIYAAVENVTPDLMLWAENWAKHIRDKLDQESVALEIDSILYLV